jgi:cytochrome c peroxidase
LVNVIRTVKISSLHAVQPSTSPAGDLVYLGHPDRAAGDPAGLIVSDDGRQILAFAGVSEIAISDREADYFQRVAVGRRPTALMLGTKGRNIYVANMMDDSVSIVPIDASSDVRSIQLGPPRELSLVEQGEQLFYDATLSSDGWLSCHSCHTDGHTNGRLNDNFGDGSAGAPKRVLSLLGVGATGPWSWSGKVVSLEEQVRKSIRTTMRGEEPTHAQVAALAAYLRTLSPPPSLLSARQQQPGETVSRGARVFRQQGCVDCHQPNRFTSPEIYDVGLQDRLGNRRFNPPSLLGVSQRSALFHDGRAASVQDVLLGHRHGIAQDVSQTEIEELIDYLNSL